MLTITTTYKTNDKGAGRITAKGDGKQRTQPYNHAMSPAQNHGDAAGTLALVLGLPSDSADICLHRDNGDATHSFKFLF